MSDDTATPSPTGGPAASPSSPPPASGGFGAWARDRFGEVFGCDLRSLAAMRIGLGLTIIMDLWARSADLSIFYSDKGVLPREDLLDHYGYVRDYYISLHMSGGSAAFEGVLFGIGAIAAFCLMIGYRTWLATLVSWMLLISLHVRMPLVLQSGDVVLRLLLFWSLFLPLGARASVDALQSPSIKAPPDRITSMATFGLMVQLSVLYIFTAALKTSSIWFPKGTAAIYALQVDHFATPFGKWMLTLPTDVLRAGTYAAWFWEWGGPFLLLIPFARVFGPVRVFTVLGFWAMHIGFRVTLDIGLFSQICVVGWISMMPAWFWDRFTKWPQTRGPRFVTPLPKNLVATFFVALVLSWNFSTIIKGYSVPSEVRWMGRVLRLDQKWNMFAPYPMKDDGWFVIPGTLRDGTEVDLWRDGATDVHYDKPELISAMYQDQRWRKYMRNLWQKKYKWARKPYARWVCRSWNAEHRGKEQLKTFKMIYMREDSLPNKEEKEPREVKILTWDCFKKATVED